jgi:hypothetical protein
VNQRVRPARVTLAHVASLGSRLTDRDRQIALDCYEHHVLTTEQIQSLHFEGARTARARLDALYTLRVLDRFRPPWTRGAGSTPYHWILDEAGAHVVAEQTSVSRRDLKWRHSTALALADSTKLRHHVEVNEFFARLAYEANREGGALSEWYGERTSHRLFGGVIAPDGYGVLSLTERSSLHILLELDRATEPVGQLRGKAIRYAKAIPRSSLDRLRPLIILAVPTTARAQAASEAIADTGAPITVAAWSRASGRSALSIVIAAAGAVCPVSP